MMETIYLGPWQCVEFDLSSFIKPYFFKPAHKSFLVFCDHLKQNINMPGISIFEDEDEGFYVPHYNTKFLWENGRRIVGINLENVQSRIDNWLENFKYNDIKFKIADQEKFNSILMLK